MTRTHVYKRLLATTIFVQAILIHPYTAQANDVTAEKTIVELVERCAPQVHPNTMLKLLKHESGFQPFIIGVNGTPHKTHTFATREEAAKKARELIAKGKNIDMGLGQINSGNLGALRLTVEQVFEPCENVRASAYILAQAYERTRGQYQDERAALDQALSIYNTGKTNRGIANGYVRKVRASRYVVPALDAEAGTGNGPRSAAEEAEPEGPPPSWDVFGNARYRGPRESAERNEAQAAKPQQTAAAEPPVMLFGTPF